MTKRKPELAPAERKSRERDYQLPQDLLDRFYAKVTRLAEQTFGRDCDGDLPVDIEIVDRTRYERLHYQPVPYSHKPHDPEERLRLLHGNLRLALDEVARDMDLRKRKRLQ